MTSEERNMTRYRYIEIRETQIPAGVRLDVPGPAQGQMVERAESGDGLWAGGQWLATYRSVHDRSIGPAAIRYYRRVEVQS